jgi:hypothetical protein
VEDDERDVATAFTWRVGTFLLSLDTMALVARFVGAKADTWTEVKSRPVATTSNWNSFILITNIFCTSFYKSRRYENTVQQAVLSAIFLSLLEILAIFNLLLLRCVLL